MTKTLQLYRWMTGLLALPLQKLVQIRVKKGKEDPARLRERFGEPSRPRPDGPLIWLHAASVGEAQSALILIERLLQRLGTVNILVTTGTTTSAAHMAKKLPPRAFHQYYPLDHPRWAARFMAYWRPDLVLWMESELWPNMLLEIQRPGIPAVLVNARLSDRSFARWRLFPKSVTLLLNSFPLILAQTPQDSERFRILGAKQVLVTDNLKYSARTLPADETALHRLSAALAGRKVWVYASTHAGEEDLACRLHAALKPASPDLLTIVVPRHPERGGAVADICQNHGLKAVQRSTGSLPGPDTDIYIADTLGELGLFYRLCPVACIGHSFSDDGGGGHNPVEAAQLNCAVLHGPNVQYQRDIYADMHKAAAALELRDEDHALSVLRDLFANPDRLAELQRLAMDFARAKTGVIERVMEAVIPYLPKEQDRKEALL